MACITCVSIYVNGEIDTMRTFDSFTRRVALALCMELVANVELAEPFATVEAFISNEMDAETLYYNGEVWIMA